MSEAQKLSALAGIPFTKMTGTGNDFVIFDGREVKIPQDIRSLLAKAVCCRRRSVGADGIIILEPVERIDDAKGKIDFKWDFYNADGSLAEMCGNGGRCVGRYAHDRGFAGSEMIFDTIAGPIRAMVLQNQDGDPKIKLEMTPPFGHYSDLELQVKGGQALLDGVNTGVPHAVMRVDDLSSADVVGLGRELRYHEHFAPAGTNVNFIKPVGDELQVRTYERGVEDETLACGTGCVASSLVAGWRGWMEPPITVRVASGELLKVYFDAGQDGPGEVFMEGSADYVYEGVLHQNAFNWLDY